MKSIDCVSIGDSETPNALAASTTSARRALMLSSTGVWISELKLVFMRLSSALSTFLFSISSLYFASAPFKFDVAPELSPFLR